MADYDIGDVSTVSFEFKNESGVNVDPGGVRVRVKDPRKTITVYNYGVDAQVVKESTGKYHIDIYLDKEGDWFVRAEGLTTNRGAVESVLTVAHSEFYTGTGSAIT
jgi:hypothetical protein